MMNEYLSPDILDEEFVKPFRHLQVTQKLLGTCRVDIRDRFVMPPTLGQKIYSILVVIVLSFVGMYSFIFIHPARIQPAVYYTHGVGFAFQLGALWSIIHNRFLNAKDNANLYVKLQKLDRLLKIEHNMTDRLIHGISVSALLNVVMTIVSIFYYSLVIFYRDFGAVYVVYSQHCLCIDIIFFCFFILYLIGRLRLINCIIRDYLQRNPIRLIPDRVIFSTNRHITYLASLPHRFETSEIDVYIKEILDIFAKLRKLYQFQVFVVFLKFIPMSLAGQVTFFIGNIIEDEYDPYKIYMKCISVQAAFVDLFVITVMAIGTGIFSNEIQTTKRLCIKVMSIHLEGPLSEKAENIMQRIKQNPPKFSVYDMWLLEPPVLLNVFQIFITIAITVLQYLYL